jgi:hypothetical protein
MTDRHTIRQYVIRHNLELNILASPYFYLKMGRLNTVNFYDVTLTAEITWNLMIELRGIKDK